MTQNGVSVVTTTWNERSTIATLILRVRTVLRGIPHEIIVVDDESPDGAVDIARRLADVTVTKKREGQTMGLLHGMHLAKYLEKLANRRQIKSHLENTLGTNQSNNKIRFLGNLSVFNSQQQDFFPAKTT